MATPEAREDDALDGNYANVLVGKKTTAPSPLPIIPPKAPADLTNAQRSPSSAPRNSQFVSLSSSIAPPRVQPQQQLPQLANAPPPPPDSHFARRPASMRTGSAGGSSFDSASSAHVSGVHLPARYAPNNARCLYCTCNLIAFRSQVCPFINERLHFR